MILKFTLKLKIEKDNTLNVIVNREANLCSQMKQEVKL